MVGGTVWLTGAVTRELILFAAVGMLLGGLDDIAIDVIWLARGGWRRLTIFRRHQRATMATLGAAIERPAGRVYPGLGRIRRDRRDAARDARALRP